MGYRQLGASDLKVSALALGTMTFGEQDSEAEAHAQLDLAVARGVNFIDTADVSGSCAGGNHGGTARRKVSFGANCLT